MDEALLNHKRINWIKIQLALLCTKAEIEPVVFDEIERFRNKCLQDIAKSQDLPFGITCSSCLTENLVICPTNGICNIRRGKCSYHRDNARKFRPDGCPNNVCHILMNEIKDAHRHSGPSYKNTNATEWCSNPWEIAKCYMPPDGYKDVKNADKTDFSGLISILINFKGFDAKISDDLSKRNNIFDKVNIILFIYQI